jgi:hypothetical protein
LAGPVRDARARAASRPWSTRASSSTRSAAPCSAWTRSWRSCGRTSAELGMPATLWSLRDLNRVKGSVLHYSAPIRHLRIRVTEMQCLMGLLVKGEHGDSSSPSPYARTASAQYDRPDPSLAGLAELAAEMDAVITHYGPLGTPLWPLVASSA